ncbi:glutathione S-transferase family protein [Candidatus Nitrotoga sp. AM1P]|uniref:glutathione S-transferase family protein n=1 Tax=Candidatus Nitrotoga sp. AM1P TaxID=2559597 RepID=UPI0010B7F9C7|nr:glutathione S-transferase family protein [Candidatus Nitrotoga sp. AM1P]BBJ24319.1 glutathione S-transferase [Candidatus Nitrotoga sp. AM1P]
MTLTVSPDCDLVLYTHPWSRGQIARWMLEETGANYRQVILDYGTSMKSDEYLSVNPMGKVPTITHRGSVVTECAAICAYLADAYPSANLAPSNADRASYYRWFFFAAGPLEAAVMDHSLKVAVSEEQERMVGYGNYERTVDVLAKAVNSAPYLAGDAFSAADVYVGSHILWGTQFGTLPKRPEFEEYIQKLVERPAYKAAKAIDLELGAALSKQQLP